ncbi:hypothetical protein EB093_00125 [bacterium]|nr:hypothetical protein [bacterium]
MRDGAYLFIPVFCPIFQKKHTQSEMQFPQIVRWIKRFNWLSILREGNCVIVDSKIRVGMIF